jgi:CheY-like chemotaxis protein
MRNIFALSAALENQQMEVVTASDGKEALEVLKGDKSIDIVLMDVMMPEMDGYEAIHIIRHEMKLTSLPVIALTAKAMTGDREKCLAAGASDYISKPVDVHKLASLMRVWLS